MRMASTTELKFWSARPESSRSESGSTKTRVTAASPDTRALPPERAIASGILMTRTGPWTIVNKKADQGPIANRATGITSENGKELKE
jgi:hypothetical protein